MDATNEDVEPTFLTLKLPTRQAEQLRIVSLEESQSAEEVGMRLMTLVLDEVCPIPTIEDEPQAGR